MAEINAEEVDSVAEHDSRRRSSWSFRSVTRDRREYIYRDKTNAPNVCKYSPNYGITSKRTDFAP